MQVDEGGLALVDEAASELGLSGGMMGAKAESARSSVFRARNAAAADAAAVRETE